MHLCISAEVVKKDDISSRPTKLFTGRWWGSYLVRSAAYAPYRGQMNPVKAVNNLLSELRFLRIHCDQNLR